MTVLMLERSGFPAELVPKQVVTATLITSASENVMFAYKKCEIPVLRLKRQHIKQ